MEYLVLYLAPAKVIEEWGKTDPEQRKAAEDQMRDDWNKWMAHHAPMIADTKAAGKTVRVQADGIFDVRNDVMLYSIVRADSRDAVAEAFKTHPHLRIPQASVEIMDVRSVSRS
jgi:hypothetical protein